MPLLDQAAKLATQRLPKIITPKTHSMIDYAVAGSFFALAAFFWRRNKRAAVSAIALGTAHTALTLCTDYTGDTGKKLGFETHNTIDLTMSGVVSSLPSLLHFADEPEAHYFRAYGVAIAAVAGLTKIEEHAGELGIDAA